jgi:sugar transferase EpsL
VGELKMKRILDLFSSVILSILFIPILVILAILIRIKMGSPILYSQVRPGQNGKLFTIYKFRTMTDSRDADGKLLPEDIRLTPLGLRIRSLSLDELPQLINVFRGDMSLVGPRPLMVEYLPFYSKEQARRHEVKPGITGWAQVNGRNAISWEDRFRLDVWYVDHQSFWLDIKILLLTVLQVLQRKGVNPDPIRDGATMFRGSK